MNDGLLAISSFGRLVGLSPSALRFYDDCGLLRPAQVDPHSGYRYYSADQERRDVLIRRLREIDLPLSPIRQVIDGAHDEAERTLRAQVESSTRRAQKARGVTDDVLGALLQDNRAGPHRAVARAVTVRSADQGTSTTLVMPVRLEHETGV